MDETDNGPVSSPGVPAAEADRSAAAQLRAQRTHFQTPTWIGPPRETSAHEATIPAQAEPEHDDLADLGSAPSAVGASELIPHTAHWSEKTKPRVLAGTVLVSALAGVLAFLAVAIISQSIIAIAGLAACAIVAVLFRGALIGASVTQVDLKGSVMRVRRGAVLEVVNLADPLRFVELDGAPDLPSWRLRFESVGGHTVELNPHEVDAPELQRIVEYYRTIAQRDLRERERRFNR
jgi:hypothetical protein